ncbi:MAG: SDR family NAD(P)-dependent oxidoreductase [Gemmatimonadetes bacterium]|nr:SDR family NAD(P)-dependent oxidoreductase [Gemmatimonadota bacterium]
MGAPTLAKLLGARALADKHVAAYTAAKHAVIGFTRAAAAEVAGTGVTVERRL